MSPVRSRNTFEAIQKLFDGGLEFLFPSHCAGCRTNGSVWCDRCNGSLVLINGRECSRCGLPLEGQRGCPWCRFEPFPFFLRSYAYYLPPLTSAIVSLKYRPNRKLAAVMSRWLFSILPRSWHPDLMTAVPLHPHRHRARGYNQVSLILNELFKNIDLPVCESAISRMKNTESQVGLTTLTRWENVSNAFRASPEVVGGRRVLIVDDLLTTGATLTACTDALIEAGAVSVYALTVGRASSIQSHY